MRRVAVIGLGGTIAMSATEAGAVVPDLSPSQLLEAVPGLADTGVDVQAEELRRLPGAYVDFADGYELVGVVRERLAGGAHGVVVTQGTDTIEESAYLLDLLHRHPAPVVVTGAMRNPTLAGADGPANLLAAVAVAGSEQARDLGVLVVFHDEIHAASRVRKTHATSVATFRSPNGGPLGYVVEGRPRFANRPAGRFVPPFPVPAAAPTQWPRVRLLPVAFGDDASLLDGVADRADGLVVAAFGAGHVPESLVDPLDRLADQVPVVLASRTGAGSVLTATYGFAGSESDLLGRGLIRAGFLDPFKSRVLLHTLLATGITERSTIATAFATAGGGATP